eukprot:TRINITY_DN77_c0_g2_i1.p1 TRINITY_DN77_c0_g2~~TRINITY_DN77_c0_g2_i1.p1  ORF type:complete len:939 (-),score=284.15 TRINITY_DN77_c0_g2_i1:598-3414(-)
MDNLASFTDAKVLLQELVRSLEDLDQPLAISVPSNCTLNALDALDLVRQALSTRDAGTQPVVTIPKKKVWSIPLPGPAAVAAALAQSVSRTPSAGDVDPAQAALGGSATSTTSDPAGGLVPAKKPKRRSRRTRRGHGVWQRPSTDILLSVFKHLGARDLCRAAQVCVTWRTAATDASMWTHVNLAELRGTLSDRHLANMSKRLANAETVDLTGCATHVPLATMRAVIALCRGARSVIVPDMPTFGLLRDASSGNLSLPGDQGTSGPIDITVNNTESSSSLVVDSNLAHLLSDDEAGHEDGAVDPVNSAAGTTRPKLALTVDTGEQVPLPTPVSQPATPTAALGTTTPWGYSTGEEAFPFSSGNAAGSFYTSGEESSTNKANRRVVNPAAAAGSAALSAMGNTAPPTAPSLTSSASNLFEPTPFNQFNSTTQQSAPTSRPVSRPVSSGDESFTRRPPKPPADMLPPGLLPNLPPPGIPRSAVLPSEETESSSAPSGASRGRASKGGQSGASAAASTSAAAAAAAALDRSAPTATSTATAAAAAAAAAAGGAETIKYQGIHECVGKIHKLSKSQFGCRFLQGQLEEPPVTEGHGGDKHVGAPTSPEAHEKRVTLIYNELYDHAIELMTDPFGNYLMQKLFEKCTPRQRLTLLHARGKDLPGVALNTHGTRVVQKIVDVLSSPAEMTAIASALKPAISRLITDLNGNHVIQRCLQRLSSTENQFIYDAVAKNCIDVATHIHGCCVFQRCLDYGTLQQKLLLTQEVTTNALRLVCDPFGNYVVQHVLELRMHRVSQGLAAMFVGHLQELSRQKFSSNVIEKSLQIADPPLRNLFVTEMCDKDVVYALIHDPYGNYVIQKGLSVAPRQQHDQLINFIKPHIHSMSNIPYAKRLLERVLKEIRGDSSSDTSSREQYHSRRDRKRAAHRARQREARAAAAGSARP